MADGDLNGGSGETHGLNKEKKVKLYTSGDLNVLASYEGKKLKIFLNVTCTEQIASQFLGKANP